MGNCQAVDAAALVIQHPSGKIDRMYWSVSASEVMKINPGHYVSLIIPLPPVPGEEDQKTVKFTKVKLLRPSDTLILGHAYRLITSQEVMKVLRAKKQAKLKNQQELQNPILEGETGKSNDEVVEENNQVMRQQQRNKQHKAGQSSILAAGGRSKSWRPSLHSITETTS
ncbi:uncharacterized protein LOC124927463 [Impatiens glandulifera]|uniref:uncharacterized protein LOC124927463 n=1 Tax=Impatiens glandulifera TaxID=253017 RepID=UPI001FB1513C|nr:uncharacterized protein LOC124927463 [Impatiens glandulifera]